jgi:hypothetical protein
MPIDDTMANVIEQTKLRILHGLEVFPFISASMLNQAIGTGTPNDLWRPCLEALVSEGKVIEHIHAAKSPTGRAQSYTIYHLAKHSYTFGNV